jgi:pimeloyl-ACP methyl ester carboxylesterase
VTWAAWPRTGSWCCWICAEPGDFAVPADPATYRCDRQVADVEALSEHLGLARMDVLAHLASGNLALLYAAQYPERIGRPALLTPNAWAVGLQATPEQRRAAALLRRDEPWFEEAYAALGAALGGGKPNGSFEPFFYGRWDAAAQAHAASGDGQFNPEAAARYGSEGLSTRPRPGPR